MYVNIKKHSRHCHVLYVAYEWQIQNLPAGFVLDDMIKIYM